MKTKICSKCQKRKSIKQFRVHNRYKDGRYCYCKQCEREYHDKWIRTSKGRRSANNTILKRLYNITIEEYDRLSEKQYHVCAICGLPPRYKNKSRLSVDHDHKTNKVRGLLCDDCNNMIGRGRDDVKILKKAIKYLDK